MKQNRYDLIPCKNEKTKHCFEWSGDFDPGADGEVGIIG